jgi:hypothetical protein
MVEGVYAYCRQRCQRKKDIKQVSVDPYFWFNVQYQPNRGEKKIGNREAEKKGEWLAMPLNNQWKQAYHDKESKPVIKYENVPGIEVLRIPNTRDIHVIIIDNTEEYRNHKNDQ